MPHTTLKREGGGRKEVSGEMHGLQEQTRGEAADAMAGLKNRTMNQTQTSNYDLLHGLTKSVSAMLQ